MNSEELAETVFGVRASKLEDAARASSRVYVRGLDQLAELRPGATGRRLTAAEALSAYGVEVLTEVAREGFTRLAPTADVAGRVLRQRREQLGISTRHVANRAGLSEPVVEAAERSARLPIRTYEQIARALALDERFVSVHSEPTGNERVAVRLRTIGDENARLGPGSVAALAEAAWVAMTQVRLEEALGLSPPKTGIVQSNNYGTRDFPAYEWGYRLAADARDKLGLGRDPIASMRELVEERLGLPIIQAELGERIAGVTIEVAERRAIAVNLTGRNRHAYVRRATIAHELGHVLYDQPRRLNDLRVDEYDDLDKAVEQLHDPVEQRANAFSIEFLAPQEAALKCFRAAGEDGLGEVMDKFGVSFTAARFQIWNGIDRGIAFDSLKTARRQPPAEWEAHEAFTVDYHPVRGIRSSRAGRFSAVAIRAAETGLISWDTAATWLEVTEQELRDGATAVRPLFPAVWNA